MQFDVRELFESNGNVLPFGNYYLESPKGAFFTVFHDRLVMSRLAVSSWSGQEKPCYLSLLMSEAQVRLIIKNKQFFDVAFVNAAYLLLSDYDDLKVADD